MGPELFSGIIQGVIAGIGVWQIAARSVTFVGPDEVGARHNKLTDSLENVVARSPRGQVVPKRGIIPHIPFISGIFRIPSHSMDIDPAEEGAEIMLRYNGTPVPGFRPNAILTFRIDERNPAGLIRAIGVKNAGNVQGILAGHANASLQMLQGINLEDIQNTGMATVSSGISESFRTRVEANYGPILERGEVNIVNLKPPSQFAEQIGSIGSDKNLVEALGPEVAIRLVQARSANMILVDSGAQTAQRNGRRSLMQSVVSGVVTSQVKSTSPGALTPYE